MCLLYGEQVCYEFGWGMKHGGRECNKKESVGNYCDASFSSVISCKVLYQIECSAVKFVATKIVYNTNDLVRGKNEEIVFFVSEILEFGIKKINCCNDE